MILEIWNSNSESSMKYHLHSKYTPLTQTYRSTYGVPLSLSLTSCVYLLMSDYFGIAPLTFTVCLFHFHVPFQQLKLCFPSFGGAFFSFLLSLSLSPSLSLSLFHGCQWTQMTYKMEKKQPVTFVVNCANILVCRQFSFLRGSLFFRFTPLPPYNINKFDTP